MPTPSKPFSAEDLLTDEALRSLTVTDTGLHTAKTATAQIIALVRYAQEHPGRVNLVYIQELRIQSHDGADVLSIGDFMLLAGDSLAMNARNLPREIFPKGTFSMSDTVTIARLRVDLQQAMLH